MIFKLVLIFATVSISYVISESYQSNKYPADLDPHLCPHYPYCDNTVLAGFAQGVASFYNHGAAPGYPASLSPHACPNYPYCSHEIPPEAIHFRRSVSHQQQQYAYPVAATTGHSLPAKYPSGVDPASCPNYPYCH